MGSLISNSTDGKPFFFVVKKGPYNKANTTVVDLQRRRNALYLTTEKDFRKVGQVIENEDKVTEIVLFTSVSVWLTNVVSRLQRQIATVDVEDRRKRLMVEGHVSNPIV